MMQLSMVGWALAALACVWSSSKLAGLLGAEQDAARWIGLALTAVLCAGSWAMGMVEPFIAAWTVGAGVVWALLLRMRA